MWYYEAETIHLWKLKTKKRDKLWDEIDNLRYLYASLHTYQEYIRNTAMRNKNKDVSGRSRLHHHAYKIYWIIVSY